MKDGYKRNKFLHRVYWKREKDRRLINEWPDIVANKFRYHNWTGNRCVIET